MCFKNDAHPALGDFGEALGASLKEGIDAQRAQPFGKIVLALLRRHRRKMLRWEKEAYLLEKATQAWARQVVSSTADALQVRRACESLGAALWCAGADVAEPLQGCATAQSASEGLLARSVDVARADEEEDYADQDRYAVDFDYDNIVGYVEDYRSGRALRRAEHGAPRRMCKEKAWVAGEKVRATAPRRAKKQKQALVANARHDIAAARSVRVFRRAV